MKAFAFVIFVSCIAVSLQETPFEPCDDGPTPVSLRVEGCDTSPCPFYKGTDLKAEWDFIAVNDANSLKPKVWVTVGGVKLPYPFPEPDACKSLKNGACPLKKGDKPTYNLKMPISSGYPPVTVIIEFSLEDENENTHVCLKLEGKVTSK